MNPALLLLTTPTLVHLSAVDLVIIVFYFALVLAIGLYLKEQANTGEDFFMAGREIDSPGWPDSRFCQRTWDRWSSWDGPAIPTSRKSWPRTGIGLAPSPRCCSSRW